MATTSSSACLLRFLDAASFGDKASEAFELWLLSASITTSYNHCILAFGGEDAVSYSILHHLLHAIGVSFIISVLQFQREVIEIQIHLRV